MPISRDDGRVGPRCTTGCGHSECAARIEYGYRHSLQDERFKQDRHGLRKDGRTFIKEPVLPGIGSRDGSATALLLTTEDLAEQKRIIRRCWLNRP